MGTMPNQYQTNTRFNFNETSEAEGYIDNVTLLRLFKFSLNSSEGYGEGGEEEESKEEGGGRCRGAICAATMREVSECCTHGILGEEKI